MSKKNMTTLDSLSERNVSRSHDAAKIEREKARRRLERIAKRRRTNAQTKEELNVQTETVQRAVPKKYTRPGVTMVPGFRASLLEHINRVGVTETAEDIENLEPSRKGSKSARDAIRVLIQEPEHRWADRSIRMWKRLLACWSIGMRPHQLRSEGIDLTANGEVITVIGEAVRNEQPVPSMIDKPDPDPESPNPEQKALMSYSLNADGLPVMVMDGVTIRVAGTPERPLFCAADVCKAIGHSNSSAAVARHVDPEDVEPIERDVRLGGKPADYVNERGLYSLLLGIKLPKCEPFRLWVTGEVLPSIRKTGAYSTGAPVVAGQDASLAASMATALTAAMTPLVSMMLESQERVMRMVLSGGMGSVGAPIEAKRFSDLPEDQKAAIIANMVRRFADQLAYEGVPHHYPVAWNSLYAQYEADTGDPVRERANSESDSSDVRVRPFDLLKREHKLDQLMEAARKALVKKP